MIGQESIRSNFPSYMESSTVLQKYKATIQKSTNNKGQTPIYLQKKIGLVIVSTLNDMEWDIWYYGEHLVYKTQRTYEYK